MYKGTIENDITVAANTLIPFKTEINSNANTTPVENSNAVAINTTGSYNISVMMTVTDVAVTNITMDLTANNTPIASTSTDITADTGVVALHIYDVERIAIAPTAEKVKIGVALNAAATVSEAILIIEKVR
ncbi:MAG: hypothetical protein KBT03_05300 [Bacteroidales bacterium]|nr:hypothetical protein [Candidatus Scybalousia scybalohippi]